MKYDIMIVRLVGEWNFASSPLIHLVTHKVNIYCWKNTVPLYNEFSVVDISDVMPFVLYGKLAVKRRVCIGYDLLNVLLLLLLLPAAYCEQTGH